VYIGVQKQKHVYKQAQIYKDVPKTVQSSLVIVSYSELLVNNAETKGETRNGTNTAYISITLLQMSQVM